MLELLFGSRMRMHVRMRMMVGITDVVMLKILTFLSVTVEARGLCSFFYVKVNHVGILSHQPCGHDLKSVWIVSLHFTSVFSSIFSVANGRIFPLEKENIAYSVNTLFPH